MQAIYWNDSIFSEYPNSVDWIQFCWIKLFSFLPKFMVNLRSKAIKSRISVFMALTEKWSIAQDELEPMQ